MKYTYLLFLLILSNSSFSQIYYSHYLDETSEWRNYSVSFSGGIQEMYVTTYFDGTENYNGYTYYKRYAIWSLNGQTFFYPNSYILVREGNDANFYAINPNTGIEQVEFQNSALSNAQVGDTFSSLFNHQFDTCEVSSIVTISLIGGLNLKHLIGAFDTTTGMAEGIGEIGPTCLPTLDSYGGLVCYTKQGQTIQFGTLDCSLFPTPQRQSLTSSNYNNLLVAVSPNPTSSIVNIKTTNENIQSIQLLDIQGRVVVSQIINTSIYQIDLSNYQKGTYFLKLTTTNDSKVVKVIKN